MHCQCVLTVIQEASKTLLVMKIVHCVAVPGTTPQVKHRGELASALAVRTNIYYIRLNITIFVIFTNII